MTKRAALYSRISTGDQHLETQLLDLRELAKVRGLEIVREYSDVISGAKSKRPGIDQLMSDAGVVALTLCLLRRLTASPEMFAISWKCWMN